MRRHLQLWGSSVALQTGQSQAAQLVSFELDKPDDVAIYLGDGQFPFIGARWEIIVGNGKSARSIQTDSAALGTVLHVVAQNVVVRATVTAANAVTGRLHASAGLGRPARQLLRQFTSNIPAAGFLDVPIPGFAAAVLITPDDTAAVLNIQPRFVYLASNFSVGGTEPIANYKPERPINIGATVYRVLNTDAVNVHSAQLTFYGSP
jgi:hypothetical protein